MSSSEKQALAPNQDAPPLGIRHFLYWMLGVATCLWLYYGSQPPKPKNLLGYLLVISGVTFCIAAGGAIAFLIWNALRKFCKLPTTLQTPGAKYAAILGMTMMISLSKTKVLSWILNRDATDPFFYARDFSDTLWRFYFADFVAQSAAAVVFAIGIYWIGNWCWRIAIFASLLLAVHFAYGSYLHLDLQPLNQGGFISNATEERLLTFLRFVPLIAVAVSLTIDWRFRTKRDWAHYFGVMLCGILLIEYLVIPMNQ